ncbi:alpha/beta hydrolase [Desulfurococcus mucosus]|uniref:alpha/beta hydrolase n=1 Tax=Desulfurococcus mucosus TaxID=2275 RepID=UPI00064EF02D|nr:alpha/beta fold hydrolase [Desulfurococcus mucosus]
MWVQIVFGLIAVFILVEILLAYIASVKLLKPPREPPKWTPRDWGLKHEDIVVETADGVKLRGWFIKGSKSSTVIVIHGYTASKYNEKYVKPVVSILAGKGYNVLVYDQRGHGESEGTTTLGYREVDDLNNIIEWLKRNHPDASKSIGVIGYSMGGAVALMHASKHGTAAAYIADSPYVDIFESGKRWIKRSSEPLRSMLLIVYPLIAWFTERKMGVPSEELRLYRYARGLKGKRILIIAGGKDDLVATSEINRLVDEIVSAGGDVELWITGSRHVETIVDNPGEYGEKINGFLERWLK